jgi:NAD(P)-dependent dehydrogenase (short-subunit alcohol dehydrogenase family)
MILDGKTVVVTGVGPGLGGETVRLALRDGANVVMAARKGDRLDAFAAELDEPERVLAVATDITDPGACAALVDAGVERFGGIDALAQVAARDTVMGTLADSDPDDFRACFDTNVIG